MEDAVQGVPAADRLARLVQRAAAAGPALPCAVVHPVDAAALAGALEAAAAGLIRPVLVGPRGRIDAAAAGAGLDLAGLAIEDVPHSHAAAERAVALVREGGAAALLKGSLHTDELMAAVVAREAGLRTERRISHCFILDVPRYHKPLVVTDAAINIEPDLETKADIARNAIDLCHALGIARPKLAVLAAVEVVTPKQPATIDAAALSKMADRGQIEGGEVDGPLAFDNAISAEAAAAKHLRSVVAGDPDILLVPDLTSGNMLAKQLQYLAGAESAGVVVGARVPIALTSRAEGARARLASCAVMKLAAGMRLTRHGPG
ncbi:bifunctional enoyl-CoA hydratase/phosphate acetyltransferase [Paracraurococcus ruber]|uniref:Phosphate acetyltransferase n=1 Tax=Paracraurococcus ruber TaxID=77675 RepID=A0ABS1D0U7_9PROT|nr:phosphate acetyltransferase [Paracraurococcus ruber]TDG31352.1 bifunctional enoyl-CoA hydratase/phosphate acetyltransferase [Paracraurococcus ruber]